MSGSSSFVECIRVMVKNSAREKLVRQLSALAVKCGLEAVNSQASQRTVRDLVASIRKSAGPEKNKTEAGEVLAAYEQTFAEHAAASESASPSAATPVENKPFRLRGCSFLFTYNYDFCNTALPDGTVLGSHQDLWTNWEKWRR